MAYQPEDENSGLFDSYEAPQLVWNLVREHVPESELPEIRGALGDALVDLCTEMYSELETWVQIWRETRSTQGSRPKTPRSTLVEPPAVKELLKSEIRLLLLAVREKASREGRDGNALMSRYSPSVVGYAMGQAQSDRVQSVGDYRDHLEAPDGLSSAQCPKEVRSSSRLSSCSGCGEELEAMKSKLNVQHMDQVVAHLQSVLTEECKGLRRDIQYLQRCVEEQYLDRGEDPAPDPTISELREERKAIEKDLKVELFLNRLPPLDKPSKDRSSKDRFRAKVQIDRVGHRLLSPPTSSKAKPQHARPTLLPVQLRVNRLPADRLLHPAKPPSRPSSSSQRLVVSEDATLTHHSSTSVLTLECPGPCSRLGPYSKCKVQPGFPPLEKLNSTMGALKNGRSGRFMPSNYLQLLPPVCTGGATFRPVPPEVQKSASRGQSVARRHRLLHKTVLVSPT